VKRTFDGTRILWILQVWRGGDGAAGVITTGSSPDKEYAIWERPSKSFTGFNLNLNHYTALLILKSYGPEGLMRFPITHTLVGEWHAAQEMGEVIISNIWV
jgi:hypothetical protein